MPANVRAAMIAVPRHEFVPEDWGDSAYDDQPLPLPFPEATISAPHMVALQLEFAAVEPGHRVLEIGTGFGYLAALLAELVGPTGQVITIEVEESLAREARVRIGRLGYGARVDVKTGDGRHVNPRGASFDRIVVSCATPRIEPAWVAALQPKGILVAPVGNTEEQILTRYQNRPEGPHVTHGPRCRFVPLRGATPPHI